VVAVESDEGGPPGLTLWTVEEVSQRSANEDIRTFVESSLRRFRRDNPDLNVEVVVKKASGKGGVLDFLRTAREVAPAILPDVAVIDATDLDQAFSEGLIRPFDDRLDRAIVQDLLSAARRMGTVDERLVGLPLGMDMQHVVYRTQIFTETAPMLWTDIFSQSVRYLFPAKGDNGQVNNATLAQYLSAGGRLIDEQGNPKIDDTALRTVLTTYQKAREAGLIDSSLADISTLEELWPFYVELQAGLVQVSVRQYVVERETLVNSDYAAIPVQTPENTPISIVHGWVLVLVTEDYARQQAALTLIETFLATPTVVTWNRINHSIPTRDSAFQELAGDDPYWVFLRTQLNNAQPEPGVRDYELVGRLLQQATEQVIRGEATAEQATGAVVDALTQ
jgi:ABC-type glycerol-3-phosphate transport system substrate-binding protein